LRTQDQNAAQNQDIDRILRTLEACAKGVARLPIALDVAGIEQQIRPVLGKMLVVRRYRIRTAKIGSGAGRFAGPGADRAAKGIRIGQVRIKSDRLRKIVGSFLDLVRGKELDSPRKIFFGANGIPRDGEVSESLPIWLVRKVLFP